MPLSTREVVFSLMRYSDSPAQRQSEDVRILPVVEPVREFVHILAQVPGTDLVILAYDAPLQDCPKALNVVRVDISADIGFLMVDRLVVDEELQPAITRELVCHDCCALDLNLFPDEACKRLGLEVLGHLGPNISSTLEDTDHGNLFRSTTALAARMGLVVALTWLTTNISLVGFNDALQKLPVFNHSPANSHSHVPCRVLVHVDITRELTGTDSFLRVQDKGDCQKPFLKIEFRIVENGVDSHAIRRFTVIAVMAVFFGERARFVRTAVRATCPPRPSHLFQMSDTVIMCWILFVNFGDIHGGLRNSLPLSRTRVSETEKIVKDNHYR